jgi:plasmid stabilization system protein ParE
VARVEITATALADLERVHEFIATTDPDAARRQLASMRSAFTLLADHPLLGRAADYGHRELMLSRGRNGYVAKYRYMPALDLVFILAVRHQREAGYVEFDP